MTRLHEAHFTGIHVAQEARKAVPRATSNMADHVPDGGNMVNAAAGEQERGLHDSTEGGATTSHPRTRGKTQTQGIGSLASFRDQRDLRRMESNPARSESGGGESRPAGMRMSHQNNGTAAVARGPLTPIAPCADAAVAAGSNVGHNTSAAGATRNPMVAPQGTLLELRTLAFTLPMPLSVNEAWHHVAYRDPADGKLKSRAVLTKEHRQFRSQVIRIVRAEMRLPLRDVLPLAGRLEMAVTLFYANRRRTDTCNRIKPLEDALTHAGAYHDDSQIDRHVVERIIRAGDESCEVTLVEIGA